VVFSPTTLGAAAGSVTVTSSVTVTNSPEALSGTGVIPTLSVLDNFNRATATHLYTTANTPWIQLPNSGTAASALQVLDLTSGNTGTGVAIGNSGGTAYWNNPTSGFGTQQAAAFQFVNTLNVSTATIPGYSLILKATTVNPTTDAATSQVRVTYITTGSVRIAYTTNGSTYTTASTLAGVSFAVNDIMGATISSTGAVFVWKTSGATTTLLGSVQLPNTAAWTTGGGLIGIQLPPGTEADNFAGASVP